MKAPRASIRLWSFALLILAGAAGAAAAAAQAKYSETPNGRFALIGLAASDLRPEINGRPGLNALRTTSVNQLASAPKADHVIVYAHAHSMGSESGPARGHPREFMKKCLDAGADAFVASGPHTLRGLEIYNGKPIFYSLGDLFMQNETIEPVPTDMFEVEELGIEALAADCRDARSRPGPATGFPTAYHPANPAVWESVVPLATFTGHDLTRIVFYPVDMGFGVPRPHQGTPRLAEPELERFARMSEVYGTRIVIRDGVGVWEAR